jgi:hypothetical protein
VTSFRRIFQRELGHSPAELRRRLQLSRHFRQRLDAALSRAGETDLSELRARVESERRADLARLDSQYVRVKRRALGTMIGAAFAAGAAVGLGIAFLSWHAHARHGAV